MKEETVRHFDVWVRFLVVVLLAFNATLLCITIVCISQDHKMRNITAHEQYIEKNFSECMAIPLDEVSYPEKPYIHIFFRTKFKTYLACSMDDYFPLRVECVSGRCTSEMDDPEKRMELVREHFLPWVVKDLNYDYEISGDEIESAIEELSKKIGLEQGEALAVELDCLELYDGDTMAVFGRIITQFYTEYKEDVGRAAFRQVMMLNPIYKVYPLVLRFGDTMQPTSDSIPL